jgi:hypothetical protein
VTAETTIGWQKETKRPQPEEERKNMFGDPRLDLLTCCCYSAGESWLSPAES